MIRILTNDPVSVPGGSWGFGQLQLSFYLYGKLEIAQCLELSVIYCPQCDLVGVASIKGKTLSQIARISMINYLSHLVISFTRSPSQMWENQLCSCPIQTNQCTVCPSRSDSSTNPSLSVGTCSVYLCNPCSVFIFFPSPKRWAKRCMETLWSFDENCHLPPTMLLTGFVLT